MSRKSILSFFLIFVSGFLLEAQESLYVDSLVNVLKTQKSDTNKVLLLNEIAWEYSSTDLKKARNYCNTSVELATGLKYIKGRSSAYNTLGNIASDEGKTDEALKFYLLSLQDKEFLKDRKGMATVNANIGIIYRLKGELEKALEYYNKALVIRQALNNKQGVADCYNNIATVYKDQLKYDYALDYYKKSIELKTELGDKRGIGFTYNNIATVYDDKSDFNLALQYHYKAAKILEEINDINSLITVYNNIGVLNKKLKNFNDAIKYSKMALSLADKTGNKSFSINIYENLGAIYLEIKNKEEAKKSFEKGLSMALQAGHKDDVAHMYEGLGGYYESAHDFKNAEMNYDSAIKIAEEMKNMRDVARYSNDLAIVYYKENKNDPAKKLLDRSIAICKKNAFKADLKKAYKIYADLFENNLNDPKKSIGYYKLYVELSDSLFSEDVVQKFAQQQVRYETDKKESEIKILKQQEEINLLQLKDQKLISARRKYFLFISTLVIFLLCVSGYFYFSRQKIKSLQLKEQAVREAEENERLRMAKDIHDDLGSGLSKIKFLSEIISAKTNQNSEIQSSIKSISETSVFLVENMRDLIWALNPENTTLESLVARIREYSSDYLNDFPIELNTEINENFRDSKITKEAHRNIFFILKESLQNIVKHSSASAVSLKIDISKNNFQLLIADNGKGLIEKSVESGNGLKNIRQRAEVIGGRAEITSSAGMSLIITVTVPLKNIEKA